MSIDYGEFFNVAHIEPQSHIYGPGSRFVVWFQGCSLGCSGCWNQRMWSFAARTLIHRQELFEKIVQTPNLHGISLLGGEPLQQSQTIWLLEKIRRETELTIFLYTGYNLFELKNNDEWSVVLRDCDVVVTGRYKESLRDTNLQWRGSKNQELFYPPLSRISEQPTQTNEVEVIIDATGKITVLGYPETLTDLI
tara:strand:+ start:53 stop:634 length:582 start_codon:yes stop_codon:yes gene_type:complete